MRASNHTITPNHEAIRRLDEFISNSELVHSLCQPKLAAQLLPSFIVYSTPRLRLLNEIMSLCVRIQELCQVSLAVCEPLPWMSHSRFGSLREELESFPLKQAADFEASATGTEGPEESALRAQCILMWHVCAMMLNRNFLPVPNSADSTNALATPTAPELFVKERSAVCYTSAIAVCTFCRNLTAQQSFLSASVFLPCIQMKLISGKGSRFVGFALFESGLVLLNALHSSGEAPSSDILLSLKIVFTILGGLRNVYRPAYDWVSARVSS